MKSPARKHKRRHRLELPVIYTCTDSVGATWMTTSVCVDEDVDYCGGPPSFTPANPSFCDDPVDEPCRPIRDVLADRMRSDSLTMRSNAGNTDSALVVLVGYEYARMVARHGR